MKKRFLSLFIGLALVLSFSTAVPCFAGTDETTIDHITYQYDTETKEAAVSRSVVSGEVVIPGTITVDEKEYTNVINVTVVCPTESYEDRLDYCVSDDFAVNEIFGDGAVILSAYQGNRELTVKRGKFLEGVVVNGTETEKLTLLSSLGGFVFENVNAYTDMIATAEEFVNVFKLENGKIIDGYYYLANDITVDMTAQTGSYYELNGKQNRYFQGIFDGQGYTLNATVGTYGLFGGFGHGTIIKNTHFNFTFSIADDATIKTACGLARNDGAVFAQGKWDVKFSNLKVTTTNYFDGSDGTSKRSYALTDSTARR